MIVAVKCNITSLALKKLNELYWGNKYKGVDNLIIENYIYSLSCSGLEMCYTEEDDCSNPTIVLNCNLNIALISNTINQNVITFYIKDTDFTGGLAPFTYQWTYEQSDFDNSGDINVSESVLSVKLGKRLELLVTSISVKVVDANGCIYNKTCYLALSQMQCADDYIPCPNISSLSVINKITNCVMPIGLIVNKKS